MRAIWNGEVIAESNETETVEGNHYFLLADVAAGLLSDSDHTSFCPWKGMAHYYNLEVDGQVNANAAWHYLEPKPEASEIAGRVAFWKGVQVS